MNDLVKQDFFQFVLNQFLVVDEDLIPWKYTNKSCYYYIHDIHITSMNISYCDIARFLCPVYIDMEDLLQKQIKIFTFHKFHSFDHLKYLTIQNIRIPHKQLYNMTLLTYLDIGMNSNVTNKDLKKMINLESLCLGNNCHVTKDIFKYLPKLNMIQIGYDECKNMYCSIHPDDIPDSVQDVICSYYQPPYPMEVYVERIK